MKEAPSRDDCQCHLVPPPLETVAKGVHLADSRSHADNGIIVQIPLPAKNNCLFLRGQLQMIAALLLLSCGAGGLAASSSADFGAFVSVAPSASASAALPTPSQLVQEKAPRGTEPDAKSSENSSVMPSSNVTTNATGKCAETTQCMMDDMVGFVRGPLLPEPRFVQVGTTHPVQEEPGTERK